MPVMLETRNYAIAIIKILNESNQEKSKKNKIKLSIKQQKILIKYQKINNNNNNNNIITIIVTIALNE